MTRSIAGSTMGKRPLRGARGRGALALAALPVVLALLLAACAPAGPSDRGGDTPGAAQSEPAAPRRTMVMAARVEPQGLAFKLLISSADTRSARRLLNAVLMVTDDKGDTYPYLASALPRLDTDSWRVFPDGRMETTYSLRPNLTWHDGVPLTAVTVVELPVVLRFADIRSMHSCSGIVHFLE